MYYADIAKNMQWESLIMYAYWTRCIHVCIVQQDMNHDKHYFLNIFGVNMLMFTANYYTFLYSILLPVQGQPLQARYSGPFIIEKKITDVDYVIYTPGRCKQKSFCHVNILQLY